MLVIEDLAVVYNQAVALRQVSLSVAAGRLVALLGANGAGKTTVLKAVSGLLKAESGRVSGGRIDFEKRSLKAATSADIVRKGIIQVMEGRRVFKNLTVAENLRVGSLIGARRRPRSLDEATVYRFFPRLAECWRQPAGKLSGGEQQMLALARALLIEPRLMLIDEPSLGLSPLLAREIFSVIRRVNREYGVSVLLVEQNLNLALQFADYAYVMEGGRVMLAGSADELRLNPAVAGYYLGHSEAE